MDYCMFVYIKFNFIRQAAAHLVSFRASGRIDKYSVIQDRMLLADLFSLLLCIYPGYSKSSICFSVTHKCKTLEYNNNYTIKEKKSFLLSTEFPKEIILAQQINYAIFYNELCNLSTGYLKIGRYTYMILECSLLCMHIFQKELLK